MFLLRVGYTLAETVNPGKMEWTGASYYGRGWPIDRIRSLLTTCRVVAVINQNLVLLATSLGLCDTGIVFPKGAREIADHWERKSLKR
jgi:hypothetical protein